MVDMGPIYPYDFAMVAPDRCPGAHLNPVASGVMARAGWMAPRRMVSSMTKEQHDILRLLLTGLAGGDSLGSSSEFIPQAKIPAPYAKLKDKGWPFKQVGGGMFNWEVVLRRTTVTRR